MLSACRYEFCQSPKAFVGGDIFLKHPKDSSCSHLVQFGSFPGNPPVMFTEDLIVSPTSKVNLPETSVQDIDVDYFASRDPPSQRLLLVESLNDDVCEEYAFGGRVDLVVGFYKSEYWIHDSRVVLQDNTLGNPLPDGGRDIVESTAAVDPKYGARCSNVRRSWQNEHTCFLSSKACVQNSESDSGGSVVCGSHGEVANDLSLGGEALRGAFDIHQSSSVGDAQTVWTVLALNSADQLRQRMAWALSQIFVSTNLINVL